MPKAKQRAPHEDEAAQGAALLAEAMGAGLKMVRTSSEAPSMPCKPTATLVSTQPSFAPEADGAAARVWKSRRAKYSHLPPITVKLLHEGAVEEVRVDECARSGDLLRDLSAGGPSLGLFTRLGLGSSPRKGTPRSGRAAAELAPRVRIIGLVLRARPTAMLPARTTLEEAGEYQLVVERLDLADDAAQELVAGTAAALGVAEDSSDWSENEEQEPL